MIKQELVQKKNSANRQNFDAYDIAQTQILLYRQSFKVLGYGTLVL